MKLFDKISNGYKKIASGIAIVAFLTMLYFAMIPAGTTAGSGVFGALSGSPIAGAFVWLSDYPGYNATTDVNGNYTLHNATGGVDIPIGTYSISATAPGYARNTSTVTVTESGVVKDFDLFPALYNYFGGGAIDSSVDAYILLTNPNNNSAATVDVMFLKTDGTVVTYPLTINASSNAIVDAKQVLTIPSAFSVKVVSDRKIAAERTSIFANYNIGGKIIEDVHDTLGATDLNTTWYFGAGEINSATSLYILIMNPNDQTANVTAQYFLTDGTQTSKSMDIPPTSRASFDASAALPAGSKFSAKITSNISIMAERTVIFANVTWGPGQIIDGLTNTIGSDKLSDTWYFAAGQVDSLTNAYILILNPNDQSANVTAQYLLTDGTVVNKSMIVPPTSRASFDASAALPAGSRFSTKVISNISIMSERTVIFLNTNVGGKVINGYHTSIGSTILNNNWSIGGGYVSPDAMSYILIANPNSQPANISAKFMTTDGNVYIYSTLVPANSRSSIDSRSIVPTGWYSVQVSGDVPIFIEKSEIFAGFMWNGRYLDGYSNSIGVKME